MKTVFATGPVMFGANSNKVEPAVAAADVRVYCLRLEAYDIGNNEEDLNTSFTVFAALAQGNPQIARALLTLGSAIEANRAFLAAQARKS